MNGREVRPGDRVRAINFAPGAIDDNVTVPPGTMGTVREVFPYQIAVNWDNGSTISLLPDKDRWETVSTKEES